jgi:hypothetical protein
MRGYSRETSALIGMAKIAFVIFLIEALLCNSIAMAQSADESRFQDVGTQLEVHNDKPSMDTTPVSFVVDGISYSVPRNYIVRMFNWNETLQKDGSPTLRVTFPGFEPLSAKTKDCLSRPAVPQASECVPLTVLIGGRSQVIHDIESKTRASFHNPHDPSLIRSGPYGYKFFEMGISGRMKYQTYFKESGNRILVVHCLVTISEINDPDNTNPRSTCRKDTVVSKGGAFEYLFTVDELKDVEEVDHGLQKLVNSFTQPGDRP